MTTVIEAVSDQRVRLRINQQARPPHRCYRRGPANARYDLVVANLYFPTLLSLADDFADWLTPGGVCILSGITEKGIAPIRQRFEAVGFKHRAVQKIDEWVAWTAQIDN